MSDPVDPTELAASESVDLTELAGAAESETQSAYAWGITDEAEEPTEFVESRGWLTPKRITIAAVVVSLVAVAGVALYATRSTWSGGPTRNAAGSTPMLDGIYKLSDFEDQSRNGTPMESMPADFTVYRALRSVCTEKGCSAVGLSVDKDGKQLSDLKLSYWFTNGSWREVPRPQDVTQPDCVLPGGMIGPGKDTQAVVSTFTSQGDGFSGSQTMTTLTNQCGLRGTQVDVAFKVARIGDVPADLKIDPAEAEPPYSPVQVTPAVTLDGLYRVSLNNQRQTINGSPVERPVPNGTEIWAFRSACSKDGCVAVGSQVIPDNIRQNTGGAMVFNYSDGQWWEPTPSLRGAVPCRDGQPGSDRFKPQWSLAPQPDGSMQGVSVAQVATNQCGDIGVTYRTPIEATRMNEVPDSVVIADPAMFLP